MPINSLDNFLYECNLVNTSLIERLRNSVLGVDVENYLNTITLSKKKEFSNGIGDFFDVLKKNISTDLKVFKNFNIYPIFVIQGLDIEVMKENNEIKKNLNSKNYPINNWNLINTKNKETFILRESDKKDSIKTQLRSIVKDLIQFFIEFKLDYIISPYDSLFQLSYMYNDDIIDAIYGTTDLLLTKVDCIILTIDFQSKKFKYVEKNKILDKFNISERLFIDLSLFVGCRIQPNLDSIFLLLPKILTQKCPDINYFKMALDLIHHYFSLNPCKPLNLLYLILSFNNPILLKFYIKCYSAFKFIPIMTKNGFVELYSVEIAKLTDKQERCTFTLTNNNESVKDFEKKKKETKLSMSKLNEQTKESTLKKESVVDIPNDVHQLISQRLPNEFYFYLSIGLISFELLEAILQGYLHINHTLTSSNCDDFLSLTSSTFYKNILDVQFKLLTQHLARYFHLKKIKIKFGINDNNLEINNSLNLRTIKQVKSLFFYNDNPSECFSLSCFFSNMQNNSYKFSKKVTSMNDIISTVFLRSLFIYQVIHNDRLTLNSFGIILKLFVKNNNNVTDEDLEHLILLILLINSKENFLTNSKNVCLSIPENYNESSVDGKSSTVQKFKLSTKEQKHIVLISRIMSLKKLNISPIIYQGPASKNLNNFLFQIDFISTNLYNTTNCLMTDFIIDQNNNHLKISYNSKNDWYKLLKNLPFNKSIKNTLLGIVAENYFGYSLKLMKNGIPKSEIIPNVKKQILSQTFHLNKNSQNTNTNHINLVNSTEIFNSFQNGIDFWYKFIELAKMISIKDPLIISPDFYNEIQSTSIWMKKFI